MADTRLTATAVLAGVMTFTTTAYAVSIPVANNSFESPDVSSTYPYFTTAVSGVSGGIYAPNIPGWTTSTLNGNIGVYAPPGGVSYTPPAGKQVGYIGGGNPLVVDPGSFTQVLGVGAQAGATYDLGVYVGARSEGYTLGDYTIALWAGGHLLDSVTDPVAPAPGAFDLTGLSYTATALDSTYGHLAIVLSGGTSDGGTAYGQVAFDDVTLTTSIPEPSTWAMMALGFAGLGFAGYRVRRRQAPRSRPDRRSAGGVTKAALTLAFFAAGASRLVSSLPR